MPAPVKKAAFVLSLLLAIATLPAGSSHAQAGPYKPIGGNRLCLTREEGTGAFSPDGFLSRNPSIDGWQGGFATFTAPRQASSTTSRLSEVGSLLTVTRRPMWRH